MDYIHRLAEGRRVWLTVNKHNTDSIQFYLRQGFVVVEDIVTDIGNGYVMDDYLMETRVTDQASSQRSSLGFDAIDLQFAHSCNVPKRQPTQDNLTPTTS